MIFYLVLVLMFLGSTLVFYSLSPYYGALGLVFVSLSGCLLCGLLGLSFVALILVLIYIGGMLVVFVYSTAISAERYPTVSNLNEVIILSGLVIFWGFLNFDSLINLSVVDYSFLINNDLIGGGNLYGVMFWYLLVGGYMLLLALFVALLLTYGSNFSVLKAL
uniref:NADH dehydrogenase subunit 6 n=1 Tax=Crossaster japonicus TaxID=2904669 RepID=UPI00286D1B55|nr:NADH dehydrogenase subunit 6 [Crossaster japonicus]WKF51895.1 NADH dehydrogenase subunit 6 [Crossaster japonicus]